MNPKHPSDLDPDEASDKVTWHLAGTVKKEKKAFDTAEECRRILMLQGVEKGEDKVMQDQVKWEPRNREKKVKRKVFWVRKQDEQLNGSKFESPDNFTEEGDGVRSMYHIYASHELGLGRIALRRIPCHCAACRRQMNLEWDNRILHVHQQPRFADVPDCRFRQVLSGRNKWHFAKLEQRSMGHKDFHEFMDDDAN